MSPSSHGDSRSTSKESATAIDAPLGHDVGARLLPAEITLASPRPDHRGAGRGDVVPDVLLLKGDVTTAARADRVDLDLRDECALQPILGEKRLQDSIRH